MAKQKQKIKPQNGLAILKAEPQVIHDQTPTDLIAMAIANNLDIDKLERLMVMQEKWEARKAQKAYFESFGRFQSIVPNLIKNKLVKFDHKEGGGNTQYKYQELGDIASHIRQPLTDTGLSYRWDQHEEGMVVTVVCIISHVDGHQERSQPLSGAYDTSGKKNVIQQKASTITYLRRYTLTGMLGLSTMEADNDGSGGQKPIVGTAAKADITDAQFESLKKRINSKDKVTERQGVLNEAKKHLSFTEKQLSDLSDIADNIPANAKQTVSA